MIGRRTGRLAAIFADDLLSLGRQALDRFGRGAETVVVPITVPVDADGAVVVSAAPPELADPNATRQPARLALARTATGLAVELSFVDGRPLRLPGVPGAPGAIAFDVARAGMAVTADGDALAIDEATARQLATALLLTFRVKLTRAERDPRRA